MLKGGGKTFRLGYMAQLKQGSGVDRETVEQLTTFVMGLADGEDAGEDADDDEDGAEDGDADGAVKDGGE